MNFEDFAEQFGEVKAKVEYHDQQILLLTKSQEALHKIATSVELLAEKQGNMSDKLDTVVDKVEEIESLPAKRWRAIVEKVILMLVAAVVTFILTKVGLG
ncbi:MAG: hypothetical protein IKU94_11005 [Bacteroidaceae bacterium]|nr:hypothetical protein [Bacteroidaceae bacterium]